MLSQSEAVEGACRHPEPVRSHGGSPVIILSQSEATEGACHHPEPVRRTLPTSRLWGHVIILIKAWKFILLQSIRARIRRFLMALCL